MCLSLAVCFSTIRRRREAESERMQSDLQQIKGVDASHRTQLTIDDRYTERTWNAMDIGESPQPAGNIYKCMVEFVNE